MASDDALVGSARRRPNRGPGAARENRAALVKAAREVFAERGLDAPLYEVARRAGVGQGSLYRHFPDRTTLVLAAFEENVTRLEGLAARSDASLDDILAKVTEFAEHSSAFLDAVALGEANSRLIDLGRRMVALLDAPVAAARDAGHLAEHVTVDEVMLAVSMLSGALGNLPAHARPDTSRRIWALVRRAWAPEIGPPAASRPRGRPPAPAPPCC